MALNTAEISSLVMALQPWVGAQIQGVHQPRHDTFILTLRRPGETLMLKVVVRGPFTRLNAIETRPANPTNGLPFQQLCRRELRGRVTGIEQVAGDRVVVLHAEAAEKRSLLLELTGRHGNGFVLDEQGAILGAMLPNLSQRRALESGDLWRPPAMTASGPHTDSLAGRLNTPADFASLSAALEAEAAKGEIEAERVSLRAALEREVKRVQRLLKHQQTDLEKAAAGQAQARSADLLQINLQRFKKGDLSVRVEDIFEDPPVSVQIALKPELSPVENMSRLYKLARKYQGAADSILERAGQTEARLLELLASVAAVEAATDLGALDAFKARAQVKTRSEAARADRERARARLPFFRFTSSDGFEIRVGRGASDNDALTFKHSRGNDFWLHRRGSPGAHVVVVCPSSPPPLSTLIEAATLALKHSGVRDGGDGEVSYTRVKYVRRAGAPGRVTITQDKSLHVRLDVDSLNGVQRIQ